jgi:hypothetical protein
MGTSLPLVVCFFNQNLDPFKILEDFKAMLQLPFFMEMIVLMSWSIWVARNGLIFDARGPTL